MRVSGVSVVVFLLMYSPVVVGSGDSGDAALPNLTHWQSLARAGRQKLFDQLAGIYQLIGGVRYLLFITDHQTAADTEIRVVCRFATNHFVDPFPTFFQSRHRRVYPSVVW